MGQYCLNRTSAFLRKTSTASLKRKRVWLPSLTRNALYPSATSSILCLQEDPNAKANEFPRTVGARVSPRCSNLSCCALPLTASFEPSPPQIEAALLLCRCGLLFCRNDACTPILHACMQGVQGANAVGACLPVFCMQDIAGQNTRGWHAASRLPACGCMLELVLARLGSDFLAANRTF